MKIEKYDLTYVTNDSVQEGVGANQILPLLSKFSENGMKIHLVSMEKKLPSALLRSKIEEAKLEWTPLDFGKLGHFAAINRLRNLKQSIQESDIIHGRSDFGTAAGILSNNGKVVWDVRSLWVDQRAFIEGNSSAHPKYLAAKQLEKISARGASGISTLTQNVIPVLEDRYKNLPSNRVVVPTIADLSHYRLKKPLPNSVKILFSGTYNSFYDLYTTKLFIEEFAKTQCIQVNWAKPAESLTSNLGIEFDSVFESSRDEMPKIINEHSFGVAICKETAGKSLLASSPTKVAEFLACGRPVVVNKHLGDYAELFSKYRVGIAIDSSKDQIKSSVNYLQELLRDPEISERCRFVAQKFFSLELAIRNYSMLYSQLY